MCRRCGAPLETEREAAHVAVPASMLRKQNGPGLSPQAPPAAQSSLAAVAAAARNGPPDTLLPGALPRPDHLLPRATGATAAPRSAAAPLIPPSKSKRVRRGRRKRAPLGTRLTTSARRHWRRILVLAVVAVAFTMSLNAVWPIVFSTDNPTKGAPSSAAQEIVARGVLRTAVGGARSVYAPNNSFAALTPAILSAYSYRVPVVGATKAARIGAISMKTNSPTVLTLATAAEGGRCVFARDEPKQGRTLFVTVRSSSCKAASAPTRGWKVR